MDRRLASVVAGALCACLAWTGSAAAAVGDLTPRECFGDPHKGVAGSGCKKTAGLEWPAGVAVSPDGKDVYVASRYSNAVALFARRSNGRLTRARCIGDTLRGPEECKGTADGLNGASAVAVSPDGNNVYVTGERALVAFARAANGALTPAGCIANIGFREDENGPAACNGAIHGLSGPQAVAVSPDGGNVYVAGTQYDAVVVLARAADGSLTPTQCLRSAGYPEGFGCRGVEDLAFPTSLAVSPDGRDVYVAADGSEAVLEFAREADGSLEPVGCIGNVGSGAGGPSSCYGFARGMTSLAGVALSPDGANVYASSYATNAFARAAEGALTPIGCIGGTGFLGAPRVCERTPGMGGGDAIAISPDGRSAYVAAERLMALKRNSDGTLEASGGSRPVFAESVAVSPDGKSVYAVHMNLRVDGVLYVYERARKRAP